MNHCVLALLVVLILLVLMFHVVKLCGELAENLLVNLMLTSFIPTSPPFRSCMLMARLVMTEVLKA